MTDPSNPPARTGRRAPWSLPVPALSRVVLWAFGLRIVAADLVQWLTERRGVLCVFPDTRYYWLLADALRHGEPFEVVLFGNLPHFSLRTPGYPLFLAACQFLFGPRLLPVRLVQAALGAGCVWLVARLTRRAVPGADHSRATWTAPLIAAFIAAFDPFVVSTAALVLSEALFLPLLLLTQWGLAGLWEPDEAEGEPVRGWTIRALLTGVGWGASVLVRPSWALYIPLALAVWFVASGRGRRVSSARVSLIVLIGVVVVMAPWWVRNARIYGKFVPTALWMGASLYDGLNPRATGASDMDFLDDPDIWPLGEEAQDAVLRDRALAFVRSNPRRVLELAAIKAARFWSPWPNAEGFRSPVLALASALVTIPVFGLLAVGLWDRRRDPRAVALLALPLAYTLALHLVFVSSIRYRIPALVPALGLAGLGARRLMIRWGGAP